MPQGVNMPIASATKEDGLESLFYDKLRLYCDSWDKTLPIKTINKKFSLLFLTKEQTRLILSILEARGLIEVKKSFVVLK